MTQEKPIPIGVETAKISSTKDAVRKLRLEYLLAGVTGGIAATLTVHPLDLLKVRFQVNEGRAVTDRPQYRGILHAFRSVVKADGFQGLYRGVTPNMTGAGVSWGLYFFIYNSIKRWMQDGDTTVPLTAAHHLLAASVTGVFTLSITNPLWVTKTQMCLQYENRGSAGWRPQHRSMISTLRYIYATEGLYGWYRGFIPGLFGTSHGALQFMAYDELKNRYNIYKQQPINSKLTTGEYITFAALSKMFAVASTYPYQVVRSRLQDQHRQYAGIRDVVSSTWK